MGILVVGSIALDSIKTPFGQAQDILGGSATYFGVSASYFTEVYIVAVVGEDFANEHIEFLRQKGINISGLQRQQGQTFRWKGEYGKNLNTRVTLDTQLNVFADFSPQLLNPHQSLDFVFLGNIHPDLQRMVLEQMEGPKLVACDTMNYWIEKERKALLKTLPLVDILIINDAETCQLAGEENIIRAARLILTWGPKTLVIKRGEYGVLTLGSKWIFAVPAFPVEDVLDPTGAGDSFAGGFMGYLAASENFGEKALQKAIVFGSVMASFTISEFGLRRLGDLTYPEIEARYREFRKLTVFEDI